MARIIVVSVLVTLVTRASAQPAPEEKDPAVAVLLSVGVTTAGAVILNTSGDPTVQLAGLGAMYLGPSTGLWYSGEVGGMGLGLRALGAVSTLYGVSQVLASENDCADIAGDCAAENARAESAGRRGAVFLVGGLGLWFGSSIVDVVLAKRAADHWNERHALRLVPTTFNAGGSRVPGLVLTGRF